MFASLWHFVSVPDLKARVKRQIKVVEHQLLDAQAALEVAVANEALLQKRLLRLRQTENPRFPYYEEETRV